MTNRYCAAVLTTGALLVMVAACSGGSTPQDTGLHVTRADFGDEWPFTVDVGLLSCEEVPGSLAVLFTHDGITYSVNGPATMWAAENGWADKRPIWSDSPEDGVTKIPTVALDRYAEQHCA
ncbi:DUF2511 domain-containing protein [Streptomyces sp. ACA25]|uniref:DUF2511 domain-containing protein n=1 Tax=Streptomyces sp. ACA25 TaxID=3022596 RepID=UPI00230704C8|nr:DUF2511 domain-containing protein [Streptomyces sp. ACA25]MDB1088023.1 DUF2511 domain-containing protein [Streptomyces sp. ACA25]